MHPNSIIIADAGPEDARNIAAIYAHHILNGTATFDTEPPSEQDMRSKIIAVAARGWPFLVARHGDDVAGYAYVTQIRDRPAYAPTCEDSIYLAPPYMGQGIGKLLLAELIDRAAQAGFSQMIAVIASGEPASVALHASSGFRQAGRLQSVGFKFGRWLDSIYMQRPLEVGTRES